MKIAFFFNQHNLHLSIFIKEYLIKINKILPYNNLRIEICKNNIGHGLEIPAKLNKFIKIF